jgi:hypothetical protein
MRMRTKLLTCLAAALAVGAISAPGASAATEVGNSCSATTFIGAGTIVPLSQVSSLPLAAPTGGVATKWKITSSVALPPGFTFAEKMRVFRATGAPNQFQTIADSAVGQAGNGQSEFSTRIPVQAGDRFGILAGPGSAAFVCQTSNVGDVIGFKEGDVAAGTSATYAPVEKYQLALSVTIEPDADGDGFGDETQDLCTISAALQAACPNLALDAISLLTGKGSVQIAVAADAQSSVTVSASAKVPKGKKGKGTVVTQLTPVVQLVGAGKITVYTLNFTKSLKVALAKLPKKKSINLEVAAEGKSLAGITSTDRLTVKLKGQAKPKPRRRG